MKFHALALRFAFPALLSIACLASDSHGAELRIPQDHATLQAAVTAAANGDTIVFAPGTYAVTAVTVPAKNLTIRAEVAGTVTLEGTGSSMVTFTSTAHAATVRGLRFISGAPALASGTNLSVFDCVFETNATGIASSSGTLLVERSRFVGSSGSQYGGAIALLSGSGQALIRRSDFLNCASNHYGGAFYSAGLDNLTSIIEYCSFRNCSSVYGGAIGTNTARLMVRWCAFAGNESTFNGGAIWLQGSIPQEIVGCSFFGNEPVVVYGSAIPTFSGNYFCVNQSIEGLWTDGGGNLFGQPCDADCDSDGLADILEIASAQENDCNANRVLDACERNQLNDCDSNGRLDSCDIADDLLNDCDADGTPDGCEIAAGSPDADQNGVPDACDPDCDGDGIIDAIEIAKGAADCDANGVPDECNGAPVVFFDTGPQRPLYLNGALTNLGWTSGAVSAAQPQRWTLQPFRLSSECGGFRLKTIAANGFSSGAMPSMGWKIWVRRGFDQRPTALDLLAEGIVTTPTPVDDPRAAPANERYRIPVDVALPAGDYWLTVYGVNGAGYGSFAWHANPDNGIPAPANSLWRSERYPSPGFLFYTTSNVTQVPGLDPEDRWRCAFRLEGLYEPVDCDGNGIDDADDIASGTGVDCDANGRLDACDPDCDKDGTPNACEILAGAGDVNANAIPDSCECLADIDLNGFANAVDLSALLSEWGTSGGLYPRADTNSDGVVNAVDLAVVLSGWGVCP